MSEDSTAAAPTFGLARQLVAEGLGTALLLAVVIGSGIMGQRLAGGNDAMALLGNTLATGCALVVLITLLGPISGAHFNPAVTLVFVLKGRVGPIRGLAYVGVQLGAAVAGVIVAHLMFAQPALQVSTHLREGPAQGLAEVVATFGLVGTILGTLRFRPDFVAAAVGLYISAAYWFTASTSFANPAVTVARCLSDTFAGIAPVSAPQFIAAQLVGAVLAWGVFDWLLKQERPS